MTNFPLVPLAQFNRLGPRPDPAHFTSENVGHLRKLINTVPSQQTADAGHPRIRVLRIGRLNVPQSPSCSSSCAV